MFSDTQSAKFLFVGFLTGVTSGYLVPIKVYPGIFAGFLALAFTLLIIGRIHIIDRRLISAAVLFLLWGCIVIATHLDTSNKTFSIKFVLLMLVFIAASTIVPLVNRNWSFYRRSIEWFIVLVILANCAQLLMIVAQYGYWGMPFALATSDSSDSLNHVFKLIGDENKNIWATKVALLYAIYAIAVIHKIIVPTRKFYLSTIAFLIFVVYASSRTAQGILLAIGVIFVIRSIGQGGPRHNLGGKLGAFIALLSVLLFIYMTQEARYSDLNLMTLDDGHSGDGLKARLIIWAVFFYEFADMDVAARLFGHGIFAAQHLPGWNFDENNLHNVFFNLALDVGLLGVALYVLIIRQVFFSKASTLRFAKRDLRIALLAPFLACATFQYSGYDVDLIVYFVLALILLARQSYAGVQCAEPKNSHDLVARYK